MNYIYSDSLNKQIWQKCIFPLSETYREGRCCRCWERMAALWCAECQRGPKTGVGLWRGPGLICQSQGLQQGHQGDADQRRRTRMRNEREVAAASSAAPGTADVGAAGSAAACWWLYVQPERKKEKKKRFDYLFYHERQYALIDPRGWQKQAFVGKSKMDRKIKTQRKKELELEEKLLRLH